VKELDWFNNNSYNLGLTYCAIWPQRQLIRIFNACLAINARYPADISADAAKDLAIKDMCCNFIAAAALVSLARAEANVETQLQNYLAVRQYVAAFDAELQRQLEGLDIAMEDDLKEKLATLLVFDFEAAIRLELWDELGEIVLRSATCEDEVAYKAMADLVLGATQVPGEGKSARRPPLLVQVDR
jgi:hypothetical protein